MFPDKNELYAFRQLLRAIILACTSNDEKSIIFIRGFVKREREKTRRGKQRYKKKEGRVHTVTWEASKPRE
jgi:hypothetical protein